MVCSEDVSHRTGSWSAFGGLRAHALVCDIQIESCSRLEPVDVGDYIGHTFTCLRLHSAQPRRDFT